MPGGFEQNRIFFLIRFRTAYVSAPIHICPVGQAADLPGNKCVGRAGHALAGAAVLVRIIAGARRAPRRDVQYCVCNYALASDYYKARLSTDAETRAGCLQTRRLHLSMCASDVYFYLRELEYLVLCRATTTQRRLWRNDTLRLTDHTDEFLFKYTLFRKRCARIGAVIKCETSKHESKAFT